jgi:ABC-type uncharacterized transport system substrate-binding protein
MQKTLGIIVSTILLATAASAADKKILIIDSYHEGYAWSDGIVTGAKKVIGDRAEVKVIRMDSKNNPGEDAKKAAAEKAKQEIDTWKPNVVIACDDNSCKYVVCPFFKDSQVPFVFCGLNWDSSLYGFPWPNVTGMEEVSLIPQLLETMGKYAKGKRVGFLGKDNETDHKEATYIRKLFKLDMNEKYVNTFEEWKSAYKEFQGTVDQLIVVNNAGITGWADAEAKAFVLANTTIPSGSSHDFIAPFVLVDYAKLASEQGEWAAGAAVQILEGKAAKDIPIAQNKKGELYLNMPLAKKLGITFPLDTIKASKVVKE